MSSEEELLLGEQMELEEGFLFRSHSYEETDDSPRETGVAVEVSVARRATDYGLSSSFDCSLLQKLDATTTTTTSNITTTPRVVRCAASWDESETSDSCKRTRTLGSCNDDDDDEDHDEEEDYDVPPTIRKPARGGGGGLTGSPATIRTKTKKKMGKLTPASAKRRRARRSPRVPPLTPRMMTATTTAVAVAPRFLLDTTTDATPAKRKPKVSLGTTATAASTLLETTTDTLDSVDTVETSTPFRFTSFPASLPRITNNINHNNNNAATNTNPGDLPPATVRKRMSFAAESSLSSNQQQQHWFHFSRDDGTHNTSISSLQNDNYDYSDDDDVDEEEESPMNTPVTRTRLNFNSLATTTAVAHSPQPNPMELPPSAPFEFYHEHGQPSGALAPAAFPTDLASPPRGSATLLQQRPARSPQGLQLHFQLDTAQCSPIPGIPEEEDIETSHFSRATTTSAETSAFSTSTRMTARPMPDLNAFDGELSSRDRSSDDSGMSSGKSRPSSPKLLCPPTPVRTPAWAHTGLDGNNALFKHGSKQRQDSLIATKVLATCEPHILTGISQNLRSTDPFSDHAVSTKEKGTLEGTLGVAHTQTCLSKPTTTSTTWTDHAPGKDESLSTNFDVVSLLGSGTFADVYKVKSKNDHRLYALKRNRRQFRGKRDRDRAMLEVRCMQRLQSTTTRHNDNNEQQRPRASKYLLFFFQAWQQDGHFFCLTELCCRETCRELIDGFQNNNSRPLLNSSATCSGNHHHHHHHHNNNNNPALDQMLPESTIWKICHDIAEGLRHIHSHGLVHNDIKPSNVFLVMDASLGAVCKIGDFGMTREAGSSDDGEEGDQKYMPSEVLVSGRKEPSADMFSLGLSVYELAANLTFELPADGPRWHDLRQGQHVLDVPTSRSAELKRVLSLLMNPQPHQRPTAAALLQIDAVRSAGSTRDSFLHDYIQGIEHADLLQQQREAAKRCVEQTPQNAPGRSCSPSVAKLPAPLIYSPEAAMS